VPGGGICKYLWLGDNDVTFSMLKQEHYNITHNVFQFPDEKTWSIDNEATLTGSIIYLKSDLAFHIKTWYPTPSISYRDSEVILDSK
jgi:hypothetical protein